MPKVSVIVPVYNTEKYLGKCIDSLLEQTLPDIEIILVDDCSTDSSFDIMTSYQEKNPQKIKVFRNKENKGPASARNLGLDIATGEYIGFVDSDDYITKDFYETMLISCEETNSDIARTNIKMVCGNVSLTFLGRKCFYNNNAIINPNHHPRYLVNEHPSCTNKLFKRELIGNKKFPEKIKWEDYPFVVPLMTTANQVVTIPGRNYYYNVHLNSTTCSDARKLNPRLLDIFTCSDIVGNACVTEETSYNVKYQINYVQMQNCIQRLKEISNANIPISEKRELLTLFATLINVKYGSWQTHELYQEQKDQDQIHKTRMLIVENLLLPDYGILESEDILKQKIKIKLEENTKK